MNGTFKLRPKRLHVVGVNRSAHIFFDGVKNRGMAESMRQEFDVTLIFVGKQRGARSNLGLDILNQRECLAIIELCII
jgi:hypothetical protein